MTIYTLEPALAAYVAESARFAPTDSSLATRRAAFAKACRHFTPPSPAGIVIEDGQLQGLNIRVYRPAGSPPAEGWPAVLYLHGGGWDMGSHETHDWFAFGLIKRISVAIIAVDYRLAPEHPFPAPLEDALCVWWGLRAGEVAGIDSERLAVAGDSAGGSIAAGLCVALKQTGETQPALQLLAYPVLTARVSLPSMSEHAHAPMLTTAGLLGSLSGYVPDEARRLDPRALPLECSDLSGLASAFIGVAQFDPLCDQGRLYALALAHAGCDATLHVGRGLVHASLRATGVAEVEAFYDRMAYGLAKALDLDCLTLRDEITPFE